MAQDLFQWLLEIPQTIAQFGNWLTTPLYPPYITLSPLAMLGIGGVAVIITIIGFHLFQLVNPF